MRIKDYTDTIRHLTDPFNIPEARRMIQENPALSRQQFAEGQLVQPGPGRQGYAGPTKTVRQGLKGYRVTVRRKTDEGVKAIDQFFSTNKYGSLNKAKEAAQGVYSQFITDNPFLSNEEFSNLYKTFEGTDTDFANFLDTEGYKAKGNKIFDKDSVFKRRVTLGLETNTPKPTIKDFKKEAKELGINIKGFDDQKIKQKVRDERGDIIKRHRRLTDPDFVLKEKKIREKWKKANPEKLKEINRQSRLDRAKKFGFPPPAFEAKEELWRNLFVDGRKYEKGRRLKTIGLKKYGAYVPREDFLNAEILDTKTNKKITFKNLENYINPKNTGKTYAEVIKPFDQKWFVNEIPGLRTELNSKLISNWTKGDKRNFFEIQHNAGRYTDPFDVSLGTHSTNIAENTARVQFEKRWDSAKTFSDKKNAFKIYKETLPEGILSKPAMVDRPRYFGTDAPLDQRLRTLKKESGVILPRGTLKKAESLLKNMDGKTLAQYKKFYPKCFEQDVGGNALRCLTKQVEKNSEKFVKNSVSIAKATEGTKTSAQMVNFLRKAKTLARGTGWLLAGEAVFAPLIALPMWAKGTPKDEIVDMLTYGAFGQDREEKIHEKLSPLGRAYAKTQELDERGQALSNQLTTASEQGYERSRIEHDLRELGKEYEQAASIFTPDPITGDYNQELVNKGAQDVDDVTKYFEDIASGSQKERAAWLAPKTSKVMETIIDKPGKAFIDFTLGPKWKENLPEQQNQFYKKRYPRNPRELGQHLSYDPDIPTFAQGGIASLKK